MITDYRISAKLEHYICMVDLFGSAGDLEGISGFFLFTLGSYCLSSYQRGGILATSTSLDTKTQAYIPNQHWYIQKLNDSKHLEKICSVFGGHLISINFPPRKWEGHYAYCS
jgi:hypothetical protein